MNRRRTILLLLVGLRATLGWAQLGLSEAECVRRWGSPTQIRDAGDSVRILAFSNNTGTIEAGLVDGVVCRFVCDKPALAEQGIQNLLSACAEDHQWSVWPSKRHTTTLDTAARRWIRSDDAAMASVDGTTFTAVGNAWSAKRVAAITASPEKQAPPHPSAINQPEHVATEVQPVPAAQTNVAPAPATVVPHPLPPTNLPSKGESREAVISRLGQPKGSLRMGDREIMSYNWGAVILHDGTVLGVQ